MAGHILVLAHLLVPVIALTDLAKVDPMASRICYSLMYMWIVLLVDEQVVCLVWGLWIWVVSV